MATVDRSTQGLIYEHECGGGSNRSAPTITISLMTGTPSPRQSKARCGRASQATCWAITLMRVIPRRDGKAEHSHRQLVEGRIWRRELSTAGWSLCHQATPPASPLTRAVQYGVPSSAFDGVGRGPSFRHRTCEVHLGAAFLFLFHSSCVNWC